jgi:hypothetical protein
MVASLRETISIGKSKIDSQKIEPQNSANKTTSADSKYSDDPDLLIREYFVYSAPQQRVQLRKAIASNLKSFQVIKALRFGQRADIHDAYAATVDLLAEMNDVTPLIEAVESLAAIGKFLGKSSKFLKQPLQASHLVTLDGYWEILIKGIACAYKIPVEQRFKLIQTLVPTSTTSNRRIIKSALIDAFLIIAEDLDTEQIKNALSYFLSSTESDSYIRAYTEEALQDLALA